MIAFFHSSRFDLWCVAFLINNGNDTTSGIITAAGIITSGNVSGSVTSTGSFGRLEATIGPFFELDGNGDIMPL